MKIIGHIIIKDLRQLGLHLVLWLAATLINYAFSLQNPAGDHISYYIFVPFFCAIPSWILWVSLFPAIVHSDSPTGTSNFWMTRPISPGALFIAKLMEVLLVAIIITAATDGLFLFSQGLRSAQVTPALERFVGFLLFFGVPLLLLATLTRTVAEFWFILLGLVVVGFAATSFFSNTLVNIVVVLPLSAVVIAAFQYRHRRCLYGIVSTLIVAVCIYGLGSVRIWPASWKMGRDEDHDNQLAWKAESASENGVAIQEKQGALILSLQLSVPQGASASFKSVEGKTKWSTGKTTTSDVYLENRLAMGIIAEIRTALGDGYRIVGQATENLVDIPVASGIRGKADPLSFQGTLSGSEVRLLFVGKGSVVPKMAMAREGYKFMLDETPVSGKRHRLVAKYQGPSYDSSGRVTDGPMVVLVDPQKKEARVLGWTEEDQQSMIAGLDLRRYVHEFRGSGTFRGLEIEKGIITEDELAHLQIWVFAVITGRRVDLPIACTFPGPTKTVDDSPSSHSSVETGAYRAVESDLHDIGEDEVYGVSTVYVSRARK